MATIIPFPETATTLINRQRIAEINYEQAMAWYQEVISCYCMFIPANLWILIKAQDRKSRAEMMLREAML